MPKKVFVSVVVSVAAFAVLVLTPVGTAISREMEEVLVMNFPDPQRVEGTVSVEGPIRSGELVSFPDITVSPVRPEDTTRLIHAGVLDADGFQHVVLSLVGQTRGEALKTGSVGVILLPDQPPIRRAFYEDGNVLVPLRLNTQTEAGPPSFFGSEPLRQTLAFPRYQVFLYNTTDKTVSVTFYAYLTSG
jgi:hypothetical protein